MIKSILPDGLTVVSERIPGVRSVSLGVWVRAGSKTDTVDKMGLAHFIEHMLFKGTTSRSTFDIAHSLESLGGSLNAFTSRNMTCYYASFLDEHLEIAVDVLSDIMTDSVFHPDEIAREKNVVIEEINAVADIPEELAQDTLTDTVLNPYPESKSILGSIGTVNGLQRTDILDYMSLHYSPENIVIAAAGNVVHDDLLNLLDKRFSFNNPGPSKSVSNITAKQERKIEIKKDIKQSHICYGGRIFGFEDERRLSLWILNTILGSGMSSRLFQNIREKHGLTYSIYSYTELLESHGIMATYAATDANNVQKTLELIKEEYSHLRNELIDEDTLYHAKSQLKGNLVLSLESSVNRMSRMAKQVIFLDEYDDIDDTIMRVNNVTAESIREISHEYLSEDLLSTILVNPI